VELNPFAGFSSRCLAYGVRAALMSSPKTSAVDRMRHRRRLVGVPSNGGEATTTTTTVTSSTNNIDGEKRASGKKMKSSSSSSSTTSTGTTAAAASRTTQTGKYKRGDTRLASYGTFRGEKAMQAIAKRAPWVRRAYPDLLGGAEADLVQLWKDTVQPVYRDAKAVQGFVNRDTLNDAKVERDHGHPWRVLVIDNIQSSSQWHTRLAGLTMFPKGNIVFWSDFQDRPEHVQMVYGCYRSAYLLPVYVSWTGKHMAFVVTRTFSSIHKTEFLQCYRTVWADRDRQTEIMKARLKQDLAYLAGLTMDPAVHGLYGGVVDRTTRHMLAMLDADKAKNWNVKVAIAGKIEKHL
jgi:hypothetical protein